MCLCIICAAGAPGGQRRVSEHLELELQVFVSHPVGAGSLTQVLWKNSHWTSTLSYHSRIFFVMLNNGKILYDPYIQPYVVG